MQVSHAASDPQLNLPHEFGRNCQRKQWDRGNFIHFSDLCGSILKQDESSFKTILVLLLKRLRKLSNKNIISTGQLVIFEENR